MMLYRGLHTDLETVYSISEVVVGLGMPRPPNLGGSESRLRSKSLGGALPVRHGMNVERITSTRGWNQELFWLNKTTCVPNHE